MWEMLEPDIDCDSECWGTGPPPQFSIPPPPIPPFLTEINHCADDSTHDMEMCAVIPILDASYRSSPSLQTSAMIAVFSLLLVLVILISSLFVWKHKRKVQNFLPCKTSTRGGHLDANGISGGTHSFTYEDPDVHLGHHRPLVMRHHNMEMLHSKTIHYPSGYPMPRSPPRFVCSSPGPDPYRSNDNVYEELPPQHIIRDSDIESEQPINSDDEFAEDELSLTGAGDHRIINSSILNNANNNNNNNNAVTTIYHERCCTTNNNCERDCCNYNTNNNNINNNNNKGENIDNCVAIIEYNNLFERKLNDRNTLLSSSSPSSTTTTTSNRIGKDSTPTTVERNNNNKMVQNNSTNIGLFRNRKIRNNNSNNNNNNNNKQQQRLLQKPTVDELMVTTSTDNNNSTSDVLPIIYDNRNLMTLPNCHNHRNIHNNNNNNLINCYPTTDDVDNDVERRNRINNQLSNNSISTIFGRGRTINNRCYPSYYYTPHNNNIISKNIINNSNVSSINNNNNNNNNKNNSNNNQYYHQSQNNNSNNKNSNNNYNSSYNNYNNRSRTNPRSLDRRRYNNNNDDGGGGGGGCGDTPRIPTQNCTEHQQNQIYDVGYTEPVFHEGILYDATSSSLCSSEYHHPTTPYYDRKYLHPYIIPEFTTFRNGGQNAMTTTTTTVAAMQPNSNVTPPPPPPPAVTPSATAALPSIMTSIPQSQSVYSRDISFGSDSGYSQRGGSGCSGDGITGCDVINNGGEISTSSSSGGGIIGCGWSNRRRKDNIIMNNNNNNNNNKNGTYKSS